MTRLSRTIGRLRGLATLATLAVVLVAGVHATPARAQSTDARRTEAQLEQMVPIHCLHRC